MAKVMKNVVCAISGGVDSCIAAVLLKEQGHNVTGVFMRNWDVFDETGYCQADRDKEDAEYVCNKIGISFTEVNFVKEYWNQIFSSLIEDYKNGFTPNPDILCNKKIKFDAFFKYAIGRLNADCVATGHYARIGHDETGDIQLLKGIDKDKDQTFFLSQVPKFALEKCMFPIGHLPKGDVKSLAETHGFQKIARKKESTGICFIGRRNFQTFIHDYITPKHGNFIDIVNGNIVGKHNGVHCWTIGQRCLIPGQLYPYYVAEKNIKTQDILVAPGRNHPALFQQTVITEPPYWISKPPQELIERDKFECDFRFQHRESVMKCLMFSDSNHYLQIFLEKPLRALTPGQFAVFYTDDVCLGSARIIRNGPSSYDLELAQKCL